VAELEIRKLKNINFQFSIFNFSIKIMYYSEIKIPSIKRTFLIAKNEEGVCRIDFHNRVNEFKAELRYQFKVEPVYAPEKLKKEVKQILEYFEGKRKLFTFPVTLKGTHFQKSVWNAIADINYGKTLAYSDIAFRINHPYAVRAVGNACGKNPVPIIIPCHRVTAKGSIGGFGGDIILKKIMLDIEKAEY
jgi:methylated-DNA-[protein]-cysteine S-methyltransferase